MKRRFWVPATAVLLSSIMAIIGSVSQDAVAGIVALSQPAGASIVPEEGSPQTRSAGDFTPHPQRTASARYWTRVIVVILIVLVILWLIYRTFTGWKPMIS